jgi:hypothetical protein
MMQQLLRCPARLSAALPNGFRRGIFRSHVPAQARWLNLLAKYKVKIPLLSDFQWTNDEMESKNDAH